MSRNQAHVLADIGRELEAFEAMFSQSLVSARGYKGRIGDILNELPEIRISKDLPRPIAKIAKKMAEEREGYNEGIRRQHREWLKEQELQKRFEDDFILAVVGRVKVGKTSFVRAMARVMQEGLGRRVDFFRMKEPDRMESTEELIRRAEDGRPVIISAPWARDALTTGPGQRRLYEGLKEREWTADADILRECLAQGFDKLKVWTGGEPTEMVVKDLEVNVLEATLEVQGFRMRRLVVMDAPGLASGNPFARERAERIWKVADMVMFLTSSDMPLQERDCQALRAFASEASGSIVFGLAKLDRHIRDEKDGRLVSRWKFARQDLEKQRDFVTRVLKEQGLSEVLASARITGFGTRILEQELEQGGDMDNALGASGYDDFMGILLGSMKREGVRRKMVRPLERAVEIAGDVEKQLEAVKIGIQEGHEALRRQEEAAGALVQRVQDCARDKLMDLVSQSVAEGQRKTSRTHRPVRVQVDQNAMKGLLNDCVNKEAKEFAAEVRKALEKLQIKIPDGQIHEEWKTDIGKKKVLVGHDKTPKHIGKALGGAFGILAGGTAGGLAAGLVGGLAAGFVGALEGALEGALAGAAEGAVAGGLVGGWIGDVFSEPVYETVETRREIRVGDNFEQLKQELMDQAMENARLAGKAASDAVMGILNLMSAHLAQTQAYLKEQDERVKGILAEAKMVLGKQQTGR